MTLKNRVDTTLKQCSKSCSKDKPLMDNMAPCHSDDILGARMLWKPKEVRILKNFIDQPV